MMVCFRNRIKCWLLVLMIASWAFLLQLFFVFINGKYARITKSLGELAFLSMPNYRHFIAFQNIGVNSATAHAQRDCETYPWARPNGVYSLVNDDREYFRKTGDSFCYIDGTNFSSTNRITGDCECLVGWHGDACSVPDTVWKSRLGKFHLKKIEPRLNKPPKRIIHAFPFNHEFEMLEARLAEYRDVVDVFLILESNYTANGSAKSLHLLDRLKSGYYRQYACKIVHVFLDYFPAAGYKNGWIVDDLLRDYISQHALKHQLTNYSSEDMFFLTDADELPRRETVLFLKLHDGYPEPVGHYLSAHTYGFFWINKREQMHIVTAVSVGLLTEVLNSRAIHIRSAPAHINKSPFLNSYLKAHKGRQIRLWSFGNPSLPSGWHCSWCCRPSCIRTKLVSAQNGDFPRWGDYPEKADLNYIKYLIKSGLWFDNIGRLVPRKNTTMHYAPDYFLKNYDTYAHILKNQYASIHINTSLIDLRPWNRNVQKTSVTPHN